MKLIASLTCGIIFGAGLAYSGMTNTEKVIGFLDLFGNWQADLLFVMIGALLISFICFTILKGKKTIFNEKIILPSNKTIDKKLIIGSAIFGCGWGIYGFCPGPAIASLAYLRVDAPVFLLTMVVGMFLADRVIAKRL
jgi:uncharacterized membrane protein YedE/YeeE